MTWTIVRHEYRLLRRNAATTAVVLAGVVLIAIAAAIGAARAQAEARDREVLRGWASAHQAALARDAANGPSPGESSSEDPPSAESGDAIWGPGSAEFVANDRGTFAVAPAPPLAAITIGQSDRYPSHFRITARLRASQLRGDQAEHPLVLLLGHFDLAFVVIYLLPLAVIALAYDLTAEERRSGVLRLVLARPVRLRTIVLGKLIARGTVVAGLVAAVSLAAIVATMASGSSTTTVTATRLVLWIGVTVVYAAFWLALAVLVDARGRPPAHNALVLASVWLIAVVLMPAAIGVAVDVTHPFPSRVQLATAVRTATHAAARKGSQLLGRFLEDHPSTGTGREGMQQYAALQEARETETARLMQPTLEAFESRVAQRRALANRLQYLSLAMLTQFAFAEIAGAGPERQWVFQDQAARYQREWKSFFAPRLAQAAALTSTDHAAIPSFEFREEPVGAIVRRVALPSLTLVIVVCALLAVALRRVGVTTS